MNECDFSHVSVGQSVTFTFGVAKCSSCGSSLDGMKVSGIYQGHYTDGCTYDWMLLDAKTKCPHCLSSMDRYIQKCDGGGEWIFTNAYSDLESSLD